LVIRPNKPIFFSVDHEPGAVEKRMREFEKLIHGKKTLFIELSNWAVETAGPIALTSRNIPKIAAYQRLAWAAKEAGLNVLALDRNRVIRDFDSASVGVCVVYNQREKRWLGLISGHGSDTVIVMHPGHCAKIVKEMQIPKENIFGPLESNKEIESVRVIADREAKRIESARLERRKKDSFRRMQKKTLRP
jgi:hypothetical protein